MEDFSLSYSKNYCTCEQATKTQTSILLEGRADAHSCSGVNVRCVKEYKRQSREKDKQNSS